MSTLVVPETLDYKHKSFSQSSYRYNKLLPQVGTQTFTLSASSQQDVVFQIPTRALNLSQSYLEGKFLPKTSSGNDNWVFLGQCPLFSNIRLSTGSGLDLVNIPYLANYLNTVNPAEIDVESLQTRDRFYDMSNVESVGSFIQPHNQGLINATNGFTFTTLTDGSGGTGAFYLSSDAIRADGNIVDRIQEMQYCQRPFASNGINGTDGPGLNFRIPLGNIRNTLLSKDKTLWFGEMLNLTLTINLTGKIGWVQSTGTAIATTPVTTGLVDGATITNFALQLATEQNKDIEQGLKEKYESSGINILVDYPYNYKSGGLGSTNAVQQADIYAFYNRAQGQRLKRIYCVAYDGQDSGQRTYLHKSATLQDMYSALNSNRLQDAVLNVSNHDCYKMLYQRLKGTISGLSENVYKYNFFWCDDFSGNSDKVDDSDNIVAGIPLETQIRYDWVINIVQLTADNGGALPSSVNAFLFAILQRELIISKNGIHFV